jgi:hypothetical protein
MVFIRSLMILSTLLFAIAKAEAGFVVFTDRAAWRIAAGGGTGDLTENFDGFTLDDPYPATAGFLNFSIGGSGMLSGFHNIDTDGYFSGSVNGTAHAHLRTAPATPFETLVSFASISAIGFDYNNENLAGDMSFSTSLGDDFVLTSSTTPLFFGLVYDNGETFSSLLFRDSDNLVYNADNFEAFSSVSAVPEPSSMGLLTVGALGCFLSLACRRKHHQ